MKHQVYSWPLLLALLGCLAACDTLPLLAPTDSTIRLVAEQPVISLNDESLVTAIVTEPAGTPVQNGVLVTFSTTLGTFDRQEGTTHDGRVSVRLFAGDLVGTATVTAFSGTALSDPLFIFIESSPP